MKNHVRLAAIMLAMTTLAQTRAGGPDDWEAQQRPHFFGRIGPRGGWNPDGRGMFHWWNPHCYPRCYGPDDYCRKPWPNVCRPLATPNHPLTAPDAPLTPAGPPG